MEDVNMNSLKLIIFLSCLFNYCFGQELQGKYSVSSNEQQYARTLIFKNGKFTDVRVTGDMGIERKGTGSYKVENKKLVLKYVEFTNKDSSFYQIDVSENTAKSGFMSLSIEDESGSPMQGSVVVENKFCKPLISFISDKSGKANLTMFAALSPAWIVVDFIGYYRVKMPVSNLLSKRASLLVKLKPQRETYINPKNDIYDLSSSSARNLILTSSSKEKLLLTKID